MSVLVKITKSLAKNKWEKAGPFKEAFTGFHNFASHFSEMRNPSISIHIINSYGDREFP